MPDRIHAIRGLLANDWDPADVLGGQEVSRYRDCRIGAAAVPTRRAACVADARSHEFIPTSNHPGLLSHVP